MSPFNCPSLFSILSFLEYEYGVFHPIGGCSARHAKRWPGSPATWASRSRSSEEVEEILFEGRRAVGVRTASGEHRADALVINADFARAMTRLVPDRLRRRWTDRKIAGKRFSCSTFMLYLGIEGRYDDLAHHTIYLAEDYAAQPRRDRERGTSCRTTRRSTSRTPASPTRRWRRRACSTLYVLRAGHPPAPQRRLVAREAPRFRGLALRQLAKVGLEDVEPRIRFEHMITPADWDQRAPDPPRRDVQPGAQPVADAAPPAAEPLRGPGIGLSGRRRHAPGQRAAGDLRVGPDHVAAAAAGLGTCRTTDCVVPRQVSPRSSDRTADDSIEAD